MRHKLCRSFHPWCPGVKNRCLYPPVGTSDWFQIWPLEISVLLMVPIGVNQHDLYSIWVFTLWKSELVKISDGVLVIQFDDGVSQKYSCLLWPGGAMKYCSVDILSSSLAPEIISCLAASSHGLFQLWLIIDNILRNPSQCILHGKHVILTMNMLLIISLQMIVFLFPEVTIFWFLFFHFQVSPIWRLVLCSGENRWCLLWWKEKELPVLLCIKYPIE